MSGRQGATHGYFPLGPLADLGGTVVRVGQFQHEDTMTPKFRALLDFYLSPERVVRRGEVFTMDDDGLIGDLLSSRRMEPADARTAARVHVIQHVGWSENQHAPKLDAALESFSRKWGHRAG